MRHGFSIRAVVAALCLSSVSIAVEAIPAARETFDGTVLPEGWTFNGSLGNTFEIRDGRFIVSALSNTYATLSRPLNIDHFRATASVQPDGSISWMPSIYLYWDEANWVQVGFRGGSFSGAVPFAAAMEDGELAELFGAPDFDQSPLWPYDVKRNGIIGHGQPAPGGPMHHYGIDLDAGKIRFLTSEDGKTWTQFRTFPRMAPKFKTPPALVIVGKGYSDPRKGVKRPFLQNDYHDRGVPVTLQMDDLSIVALTDEIRSATKVATFELADKPGQSILAKPEDPTFEAVDGLFPAMKYPREVVGVKDHPDDFGITTDGAIQYDGGYAYIELEGGTRFGITNGEPVTRKTLHEGYMPIVSGTWSHGGIDYEQLVFAHSEGFSADKPIEAYVRLRAKNTSSAEQKLNLALRKSHWNGTPTDGGKPVTTWELTLPAGGSQDVIYKLGFGVDAPVTKSNAAAFDSKLAEVMKYWQSLLNGKMTIDVPEPRVRDAYRAWLAYNFLDVDKVKGQYEPRDGSGFYDLVYGISAAIYCRILDEYGYHEDAGRYLDSLLTLVKPDGEFIVNYGLPDSGALLIALDEHYRTTRDTEWLKRVAPQMVKVADYIVRRSENSKRSQSPEDPCYGLIYEQPYCDHPGPAYSYVADLNLAAGLFSACSALRDAGMNEQADRYQRVAEEYQKNILRSIERSTIEIDGQRVIPMFPQTQKLLKAAEYTAADYYTLLGGQMLEKGLIHPTGWEADAIVNLIENRGGLTLGMCRFGGGIDHAYTYGYWFNSLQRGDARKALLGLYGSMAYGMSRDTYSGVEVTNIHSGKNMATLPHLYSGTQQLRLLRSMLLYEDGNTLVLGQGVARHWLADGKKVAVTNAATTFGTVSYTLESSVGRDMIVASITPPPGSTPTPIRLRVRHPAEKPIKSVTVNGVAHDGFKGDTVELSSVSGPARVELLY